MSEMEQRFNAAVNVIRGLPKSGSYQPSNDMMLRFYSYFKQATLGPCTQKRPPFWDIVGRAKYDSHKGLGNMPKERAMELYVDELKKIMETMSHADNSSDLMGNVSELNGIDICDLEAVAPEIMKKIISHPNSPFASREASPIRVSHENGYTNGVGSEQKRSLNGTNHSEDNYQSGHSTEHSDDEYIDTVEDDTDLIAEPIISTRISRSTTRRWNGNYVRPSNVTTAEEFDSTNSQRIEPAINQILRTIELMNSELQQINRRIDIVERLWATMDNNQSKTMMARYPRWWPFSDISPKWFIFMLLWPYVAKRLGKLLQKKSQYN